MIMMLTFLDHNIPMFLVKMSEEKQINTKKSPGQGLIFKTTFKIQDDPGIQIINRIGEKVAGSGHPIHFYLVSESSWSIHF